MKRLLSFVVALVAVIALCSTGWAGQLAEIARIGGSETTITPLNGYMGSGVENMAGDINGDRWIDWVVEARPHWYGVDGATGAILFDYFDSEGRVYQMHSFNYNTGDSRNEIVVFLRNPATFQVDTFAVYEYVNDAEVSVTPTSVGRNASIGVFPNPATQKMTLFLSGFRDEDVVLDVYDVNGRKVSEIFHGRVPGPTLQHEWAPTLASGVYFIHALGEHLDVTSRAVILR